jgi:hypothetical protein
MHNKIIEIVGGLYVHPRPVTQTAGRLYFPHCVLFCALCECAGDRRFAIR